MTLDDLAERLRAVLDDHRVINLQVTKAASPYGYYYAPDPSSQQICSIGGNVAENSGGAHCLKYGFTTNHVTGAQIVSPEGTLGIATEVTVRLVRLPETVRTLLPAFGTVDEFGAGTSVITAAGM